VSLTITAIAADTDLFLGTALAKYVRTNAALYAALAQIAAAVA
jgi:hypothetical protein